MRFPICRVALAALVLLPAAALAQYVPPRNLAPDTAAVQLDKSFRDDAWLVYGYDIDPTGTVVNPRIISSNGVAAVEQAVLAKVVAMQFAPATRDGQAVKATA